MRAIKTLREETHRRAEQSVQLKTHTEQHSQRRLPSQQPESEALFQQKLDRLVEQKREQQRRDRQCQQRLDALATQRQRVAALLRVHFETNEKLNNELVASSYPSANNTVSDEASKEVAEVSSRLNQDLSLQLVASFNEEVSKELGGALRVENKVAQAPATKPCPRAGFGGTRRWTRMQRQGRTQHWPSTAAAATAAGATRRWTLMRPTKPATSGGT